MTKNSLGLSNEVSRTPLSKLVQSTIVYTVQDGQLARLT